MTRYLPVVLMVLASLGAGAMIVPSAWEMAFMKIRDKDFAAAERAFEDKYLAGDRSREVLWPLSDLYVRSGRIEKAIEVLTKYKEAHPGDRDVTARLAELLTEAQQPLRALPALEELTSKNPTPKALRELDRQYDIAENVDGRIGALVRLAKMGAATSKESLVLTNLYAAKGEKTKALTAAYNAVNVHGRNTPHELLQVFSALAIDAGRKDLIEAVVVPWAKAQSNPVSLGAVASALVDKESLDSASHIVRQSAAFAQADARAYVLAADIDSARGRKKQAYVLLAALKAAGRLPPEQDGRYVSLALDQNEVDAGLSHISARGVDAFQDALMLYAVGHAAQSAKNEWLKSLDAALAVNGARALVAARVALALGDPSRASQLAGKAETAGKSVALAQVYADLGDLTAAERVFLASAPDASGVAVEDLTQAVAVSIALKRGEIALQLADRLAAVDKSGEAAAQRARALTLNGRADEALEILAKLDTKSELVAIAEIEALSAAGRFAELRGKLIAKLLQPATGPVRRTNLIFLLNDLKMALGAGAAELIPGLKADLDDKSVAGAAREARLSLLAKIAPTAALPYLKTAAESDPGVAGYAYVKTLKDLGRKADLNSFLLLAAKSAKTAKVRDDFLYELIAQGGGREILPLLAERTKSDGAKWFYAYDLQLAKSGTRQERLEALQAFAALPSTTPEMRRQIAFQMLNLGDKPHAEAVFRALSAKAGPGSDDVRQLAFLWGPRPPEEALSWLKTRAESAPEGERAAWAALLTNAGGARSAESVLTGSRDPASMTALASVYAETKNLQALRTLIEAAQESADRKTLIAMAEAASAAGLNNHAANAFERAGSFAEAGRAAHFAGDPARAVKLFARAKTSPETAFYWGEALVAMNRANDAQPHYREALAGLGHGAEPAKMRVVALARLKDHVRAERELKEMAADPYEQADARSAYADALLDQGDTRRAAAQLSN